MIMGAPWKPRVGGSHGLDPLTTRRVIDSVAYLLAFATFMKVGDTEILLHAWWVTIAIGGFVYGLRIALLRIAISGAVTIVYGGLALGLGLDPETEPLDFAEWPLMLVISMIVAVMAHLVATSANRYAVLYRQASDRLHTAHEEERARLARDVHDGVGQTLTAVILTLDAVDAALRAGPAPASAPAQASVRRARVLAESALGEARDVASRLRPTLVHDVGLGAALVNLAQGAGVPVEALLRPESLPAGILAADRELDTYRIVQEAIGNAARHSAASRIWLRADVSEAEIRIEIGDDGVGFDSSAHERGLGLDSMAERATLLDGQLIVDSRPGEGTTVTLTIPRPVREEAGEPVPAGAAVPAVRAAR